MINEGLKIQQDIASDYSSKVQSVKNDIEDYYQRVVLISTITNVARSRKELVKKVDEVKSFYLVDAILQQYVEDALSPDISTGDILEVRSDNSNLNKELKYLDENFKFDSLVEDIAFDLLCYGEYTLSTKVEKDKGLVELNDDVDQSSVFAVTKSGEITKYLVRTSEHGVDKVTVKEPFEYVKFMLSGRKVRLNLVDEIGKELYKRVKDKDDIPRFVRVGRSLIYSIIPKIKELQLLEALVPASKLNKMTQGSVVGVAVPSNTPPDQAFKVAKRIEDLLNKRVGVNTTTKSLAIEDAIAAAGKLKVVPVFGDKGQLQKFDYKMDEPDDLLNSIEDLRKVICTTVGIPYEILFGGEGPKGELLKRYARYLRRLKSIQRAICNGIKQIVFIHLVNKGISFTPSDIEVSFRNKLVEIDNLDSLEFMDASVGMLSNVKDFIFDLASEGSPLRDYVDFDRFVEFLNKQFSIVGLGGVVRVEEK